ncbi:hypothetical protein LEP1GSC179_0149 [Leptospira santarosai str. MOR084]|uniref:Uncharacterized protein n=1 Tax=Leptospira santarosai str. MOR084 TaxID=1049984 RepID=A0A0E2BCR3_9LEPT|nr:hypothetical protein LEP1GSC179_0149 [Leptospira santarosai str. MOR084]
MSKPKNQAEEQLNELIKGKAPEEFLGNEGLLKQLTKALIERARRRITLDMKRIPLREITQVILEMGKVARSSQRRLWNHRVGSSWR